MPTEVAARFKSSYRKEYRALQQHIESELRQV